MNNSLVLAYLGDSIYELYIRKYLITKYAKVNELQKESIKYVSAKSQSEILSELIEKEILKSEEIEIVKRARNHKSNHKPKYVSVVTYKNATGLEALIGYLYFKNDNKRIDEIMDYILESRVC